MVEIAAITCEKLSNISSTSDEDALSELGVEYISLAKDIKISLREHVQHLIDLPSTHANLTSIKDHKEVETWALKTEIVLKQLSVISSTFNLKSSQEPTGQNGTMDIRQGNNTMDDS